jgi:hypothetical protein
MQFRSGVQQKQNQQQKKTGETSVRYVPKDKNKKNSQGAEYTDFEEIE